MMRWIFTSRGYPGWTRTRDDFDLGSKLHELFVVLLAASELVECHAGAGMLSSL